MKRFKYLTKITSKFLIILLQTPGKPPEFASSNIIKLFTHFPQNPKLSTVKL